MFNFFLSIQVANVYLLIIIILFFFCLGILWKNKLLKKEIEDLKKEQLLLESKFTKVKSDSDTVSIKKISKEENLENDKEEVVKEEKNVSNKEKSINKERVHSNSNNVYKSNRDNYGDLKNCNKISGNGEKSNISSNRKVDNKKNYYSKNVLQNKKRVTSPVSINNNDSFDMDKLSFDLNEFIKKEKKVVPKIKEKQSSSDYLKEISDKLADEMKPQTIELTDYEKKQEESAIISYKELLKVKDQIQSIDDEDDGTVDFIEELKNFRNSLN